jgi:antitoxin component YwqK of YwqJK toxin-antitoxin module
VTEARIPDSELEFDNDLTYTANGELFTGIGYEDVPGRGLSEVSYRDGLQDGPARDYYPSGRLKGESHHRENTLHGVSRDFDPEGNLLNESLYEYGILVRSTQWDSSGRVLEEKAIDPDSPNYRLLERHRREKKWPM